MDRAYTRLFFGWQEPKFQYGQQECFAEAYLVFGEIARSRDLSRYVGWSPWCTSGTKVLDNVVIGAICAIEHHEV
jgi:hypothetical protein